MKIDIEKIPDLVANADAIFLSADGERHLLALLDIRDQVEAAIDAAKAMLETKAGEINPDFNSIQGDAIKVSYRYFGAKYYLDDSLVDQVDRELYKVSKRYNVDSKAVENWIETHKGMPVGINEVERKKQITFGKRGAK